MKEFRNRFAKVVSFFKFLANTRMSDSLYHLLLYLVIIFTIVGVFVIFKVCVDDCRGVYNEPVMEEEPCSTETVITENIPTSV